MHAIMIMLEIEELGYIETDHLKAALLHDIGKIIHPLRIWERVIAVLCKWVNDDCLENLNEDDLKGWKRGLVIMKKHPEWGAELISNTDASENLIELISKHHEGDLESKDLRMIKFLDALRAIDEKY